MSGEINRVVSHPAALLKSITEHYQSQAPAYDDCDGVSLAFAGWRFNLRGSNTEPLLRLNVETRGDTRLLAEKTEEVLAFIAAKEAL